MQNNNSKTDSFFMSNAAKMNTEAASMGSGSCSDSKDLSIIEDQM